MGKLAAKQGNCQQEKDAFHVQSVGFRILVEAVKFVNISQKTKELCEVITTRKGGV
jgi:hypothetical protein